MKLDIGCGSRKVDSEYIGLDLGKSPCVNVVASAVFLPFKAESFAEIYTRRCLQHIKAEKQALSEVNRTLKREGKARIIVASWTGWLYYQVKWLFKKKVYTVFHLYSFRKLKRILKKQGFRIARIEKMKSAHRFGYDIIAEITKMN